jgi:hypothetical protein
MINEFLKRTAPLMILALTAFHIEARPQQPALDGLEKYLTQRMVRPEAVQIIKQHLVESGTSNPLDELVAWAKAGLPDLHNEHGIWISEGLSLRSGVSNSIHYYFLTSPPENKSERYLEILNELRSDDYLSQQLTDMAYLAVSEAVLENEVLRLLMQADPKLRAQGVRMGRVLAGKNRPLFERYFQMLKSDDDAHVRVIILYSVVGIRTKEVAYVGLERLVNDPDADVRDWGARVLRNATELRILTEEDLPAILAVMLKTKEPLVRISIGRAAARLTTDRSFGIREDEITDELLAGFIKRSKLSESKAGASLTEKEVAKLWLDWWTPLIPKYAKPMRVVE